MLTTQRLQLRAFTDDDYVNWTSIWNDPANQALFSEDLIAPMTPLPTDELRRRVNDDRTYTMLYLSITIKSSGELIGCVTATKPNARSRQSNLAVMISKDHRWFGCDIEAMQAVIKHCFEVNAIHRVSLSVFANNQVELKHYKELQAILLLAEMTREVAHLRQRLHRGGQEACGVLEGARRMGRHN